jgi:hypothetical protein
MLNLVALADAATPALDAAWLDAAAAAAAGAGHASADGGGGATASHAWAAVAHALDADDESSYVGLVKSGQDTALVVKLAAGGGQVRHSEGRAGVPFLSTALSLSPRLTTPLPSTQNSPAQPLWATPIPHAGGALTGLVHVLELDAVVAATAAGDLLTLGAADGALEEVGTIAGGVAALAW